MKVIKWLDAHLEEVCLVILSAIMVVIIFLQVFMRYVMENSLSWSEELARYCFIWLVYIGISYGVKKERHIKVDVLLLFFKNKGKTVLYIISNLLFLVFAIIIMIYGYGIAEKILQFGQTSPAIHIPMGLVYLATPVGMALTSIRLIQNLFKLFSRLRDQDEWQLKTEYDRLREE